MDAEVKIADLEEEADELGRYVGKRKAVEGSGRRVVQGGERGLERTARNNHKRE